MTTDKLIDLPLTSVNDNLPEDRNSMTSTIRDIFSRPNFDKSFSTLVFLGELEFTLAKEQDANTLTHEDRIEMLRRIKQELLEIDPNRGDEVTVALHYYSARAEETFHPGMKEYN